MQIFLMRFLRHDPTWNLYKLLKLIFTTLVLPVVSVFSLCVTCFLIDMHEDE